MASTTQTISRAMLILWIVLIFIMSVLVSRYTDNRGAGNLITFLFTEAVESGENFTPTPPILPTPPVQPEPKPVVAPSPAPPVSEWKAMDEGKKKGDATFSTPKVHIAENGELSVTFPYEGSFGEYALFHPSNVVSLSVDLFGNYKGKVYIDTKLRRGVVSRLQIAMHSFGVRTSVVMRDSAVKLSPRVEYSTKASQIRIVFEVQK